MLLKNSDNYLPSLVLAGSITLGFCFSYWLLTDSEYDRISRVSAKVEQLLLQGKREEGQQLIIKEIGSGDLLDPAWSRLASQLDRYLLLEVYERIVSAEPSRERTYKDIADLIETAPDSFHEEVKTRYFSALKSIPKVSLDYLEKYGLLETE